MKFKETQQSEIENFFKAWMQADKAQKLLRTSLDILQETAKVFTNEDITPTASYTDGVHIIWEDWNSWGCHLFFFPQEFLDACNQRKTKEPEKQC